MHRCGFLTQMDSPGFEPGASRVQGGRSTVELRALAGGFSSSADFSLLAESENMYTRKVFR